MGGGEGAQGGGRRGVWEGRACERACVRACVRASVRACVRACVREMQGKAKARATHLELVKNRVIVIERGEKGAQVFLYGKHCNGLALHGKVPHLDTVWVECWQGVLSVQ